MTQDLPDPFVPSDVDLRDFAFMPVDIGRLFNSGFHARSTDAEWRAGMTLWLKSYHQVPASSLPDDDVELARLAEFGKDMRAWKKVRDGALRGWTKCGDGKLYHRTVAEKALEGWIEKLAQRKSSGAGNAKRYGHTFDSEPIDVAIALSRVLLAALNPQSRLLAKRGSKSSHEPPDRSADGTPDRLRSGVPPGSQGTIKGQGNAAAAASRERVATSTFEIECRRLVEPEPVMLAEDFWMIEDLLSEGLTADDIRTGIREAIEKRHDPQMRYRSWAKFVKWCRTAAQNRLAAGPRAAPNPSRSSIDTGEPRVDFGGGYSAPISTIRKIAKRGEWLPDWGPRPGEPGCRVSKELLNGVSA